MKRKLLQLATLVLAGFGAACDPGVGRTAEMVNFRKVNCYLTTINDTTVSANDTLVCFTLVQDAEPGDTTDVEKK